jgi:excisionase family DNA binding protein
MLETAPQSGQFPFRISIRLLLYARCRTSAQLTRMRKTASETYAYLRRMTKNQSLETLGLVATASADEILQKSATAERLKISTRTLDQWMRAGRVPFLKIGKTVRFRWNDVVAHLEENFRAH